eukprot:4850438-Amphidinium_carterae.1
MKWNTTQTRLQTEHKQPMDTYRPSDSKRFKEDQAHEFDGPIEKPRTVTETDAALRKICYISSRHVESGNDREHYYAG